MHLNRRGAAVVGIVLAGAVVSCAAIIGIEDRLPEDGSGLTEAGPEADSPETSTGEAGMDGGVDASGLPTYGVGDGHTGAMTVSAIMTVNSYGALASAASNTNKLSVKSVRGDAFTKGDLVIIWQTATTTPAPSNGPSIDLAAAKVGHWEVARATQVVTDDAGPSAQLTLDHPVAYAYTSPGAQVIRVPEYTDLTIQNSFGINASAWDGLSGGVVALYVNGTLRNSGTISTEGAGFRGGIPFNTFNGGLVNCTAPNGVPESGFAHKGEGFVIGSWGDAGGMVNVTTGGGGGDCLNAGGGGGGNGGRGGQGGLSSDGSRDVGGRGGAMATFPILERLLFGGGGGAGELDDGIAANGGAGGGVILIRAKEIALPGGSIRARGVSPADTDFSGGAGGGGGGTVLIQTAGMLGCTQVTVRGGSGADVGGASGPGGGGGGGRVLLQGAATACSIENRAGSGGDDNTGVKRGSAPDSGAALNPPYAAVPEIVTTAYCATCP